MVAYVCAIAMVVASMVYAPATKTSAGIDPSTLDYTMVESGGNTIGYSIVTNTIVGSVDPWYGDGGVTFQMIYSGDNLAADTTVKINDTATQPGGVVNLIANGLVKLNPSLMDNDAYTSVEIETTTGSALLFIKKGDPSGPTEAPSVEPTSVEPTSEEPSVEPTSEAPASEWTSVKGLWGLRKADGSFDKVADGGKDYDGFDGIAAFYSSGDGWAGADADVKAPSPADPDKLDVRVNALGNGQAWSLQVHINKTGLDATKIYSAKLSLGSTVLSEKNIKEKTVYSDTIDLAGKLPLGESTLSLTVEEQVKPDPPVVQTILIGLIRIIQLTHMLTLMQ